MNAPAPLVRADPDPRTWASIAQTHWERTASATREARKQLNLPTDRPIIMTGHQLSLWHPGVLSKYFAADIVAKQVDGATAWLWVDQDTEHASGVTYPVTDATGVLRSATHLLRARTLDNVAVASLPAERPPAWALKDGSCLASVERGIGEIIEAFAASSGESNAAKQAERAICSLLASVDLKPSTSLLATSLASTTPWRRVIDAMKLDPRLMAEHYNAAVAQYPEAGIAALKVGAEGDDVELPLWRLSSGKPRERVTARDLNASEAGLAPRALLMTALARMAYCDLFIHGIGGSNYDRITDQWLRNWLDLELAPSAMITADLRLPLDGAEITQQDVAQAFWRAHHVRHDPQMLGDSAAASQKQVIVDRIAQRRERNEHPLDDYHQLQHMLETYRSAHEVELKATRADAERAARLLAGREAATSRTWAFPLHAREALRALQSEIESVFNVRTGASR